MYEMIFKGAAYVCVYASSGTYEATHLTANRGTLYRLGPRDKRETLTTLCDYEVFAFDTSMHNFHFKR